MKDDPMKNKTPESDEDGMLPEYDFSGKNVVRGKHAKAMRKGYTITIHNEDGTTTVQRFGPLEMMIELDPDVSAFFPDSESVNRALRTIIALFPQTQVSEQKTKYHVRKKPPKSIAARK